MERNYSRIGSLVLAGVLSLSLAACGGDEAAEDGILPSGTYPLTTASTGGQTVTAEQLEEATGEAVEYSITFRDDGTGELYLTKGTMEFTWEEDGSLLMGDTDMQYTFDGTTVALDAGDNTMYTFGG